jgi:hypothetical protein
MTAKEANPAQFWASDSDHGAIDAAHAALAGPLDVSRSSVRCVS